jgi:hypothetical protein
VSVSRYPVVDAIEQPGGQQTPDRQKAPCTPQIARSPKSRRRADEYCFLVTARSGIYPDHRVNALQLRVPARDLGSKGALERGKPESMLPLVLEYEGHARRTEAALPIVQQQGSSRVRVPLPSPRPAAPATRLPDRFGTQDLTSSTRRLFARPSAVLLSVEGLVSP